MPGIISVENTPYSYSGLLTSPLASAGAAISAEGHVAFNVLNEVNGRSISSETLSGHRQQAIRELRELTRECVADNWDGAGAVRIQGRTENFAEKFIRTLPYGTPMPELAASPDGSISLDWMPERGRMLSLLVGPDSRLPFAWIDRENRGHGVADFDGVSIPSNFLDRLLPIFQK